MQLSICHDMQRDCPLLMMMMLMMTMTMVMLIYKILTTVKWITGTTTTNNYNNNNNDKIAL